MNAVAAKEFATSLDSTKLDVKNLSVEHVIVHRVFSRADDKTIPPPKLSGKLIKLPVEGREAIQQRITTAIGNKSHGVEMSIERVDPDSFFQTAADLIHATDTEFAEGSKTFALQLTQSQGSTNAPAGMLAIVRGRVGTSPRRYIAVIKADVHDGFGAVEAKNDVELQYLESLLLTAGQKLYKVGLLVELESAPRKKVGDYDAGGYRAFLFDHLITATETRSAAVYFFGAFLGMGIQSSSKKLTRDFFEHTKNFINTSSLDEPAKSDLREALRVELRSSSGIINAGDFAKQHFPADLVKPYRQYLESQDFPKSAVVKDTEYVKSRLRKPRKLIFTTGVSISVPSDLGSDAVEVVERTADQSLIRVKGSFVERD